MSLNSQPFRIAIVGGGIGGLFAALSIQHFCKYDRAIVDIYEQAHEYKEIGAGVSIGINAVNLLKAVGLYEEIQAISSDTQGVWLSVRRFDNGDEIVTIKSGEREDPYHFLVHRADFLNLLVEAVKRRGAATLHNNKQLINIEVLDPLQRKLNILTTPHRRLVMPYHSYS
jgi:salicylate hydroxylase